MEITDELVEYAKKKHTTQWTTFELKVGGNVRVAKRKPVPLETIHIEKYPSFWARYTWKYVKENPYLYDSYKKLLHNFMVETVSYDDSEGFEYMWIFFCSTIKPGLEFTDNYYPVGMCGILEGEHDVQEYTAIWMHPYLRSMGFVKKLMIHLFNQKLYLAEPPVTLAMSYVLNSVMKELSPERVKKLNQERVLYDQKNTGLNLKNLSEEEVAMVTSILPFMKEENKNQENIDKLIELARDENVIDMLKKQVGNLDELTEKEKIKKFVSLQHECDILKRMSNEKQ